ncbi:hydroxymethylglutaryl-CoA lyase [Actinomadura bangladeshensis]|uniref:Hydroxymethylglutaryl-CoA lyase n=1 Tax=Actinomadura bangladeshensis TaxID=453573 RepID=A0A6L9QI28_9ACTN|nr:hydroxymethylglutaryl-CoA lyase [Actinomadura bangladeshensis]NEA25097.1 hydroxymethylglutaryl-CoA lyase [Actinomadura bangladeshensis]
MTTPTRSRLDIREVGPRDGLQNEPPISTEAKVDIIEHLVRAGARRIEATSFVSPRAVPALADAADVAAALPQWPDVQWSALVAGVRGAERAVAAGIVEIEYVVSAADGHSKANVGRTTEQSLQLIPRVADVVRQAGGVLEVIVATAWDCPFDGETPPARTRDVVARAIDGGAERLCLADTIGTVTPGRLTALLEATRRIAPGVDIGVHLHNTRGTGLASAYAALLADVNWLDSSIGGLGGCPFAPGASGNIATEELVYMAHDLGLETGFELEELLAAGHRAQEVLGVSLPSGLLRAGDRTRAPA